MIKYIQPVPVGSANGLVAEIYSQVKSDFTIGIGRVAEPIALHSPSPRLLAGVWSAIRESLLAGRVRRDLKEAVVAAVSRTNRCPFCVEAHSVTARDSLLAVAHQILDPRMRSIVAWASATRSPGASILLSPPFSKKEAPEIIGTAVIFHYINRMVNVLLQTPLPSERMKGTFMRVAGYLLSGAFRSKPSGVSLKLLPEAELPPDLAWAESNPATAGAFARFAKVVEEAGRHALSDEVRARVREHIEAWNGEDPGFGRKWVEQAVSDLDEASQQACRVTLQTALASYQVDDFAVRAFRSHQPRDDEILGALAWASFTAARRVGSWLPVPS